jgi:large subunit ribosomal protein L19
MLGPAMESDYERIHPQTSSCWMEKTMDDLIESVEQQDKKDDIPHFRTGDTIRVHQLVREGEKDRVQVFEGIVVAQKGSGSGETVTVRKISIGGIGVEKIFPLHSPRIEKFELVNIGRVSRSKLYYLRDLQGKSARVQTKRERKGV